ncbi:integrator complex subunit 8 [Ixodes scapularis]
MEVCEDESAPPSMPAAPVVVSWLDFLLDDTLLEKHLSQQEKPDPSAFELVIQFLSNATELPSPGSSTPGNGPQGGLEGPASGEPGNCSPEHETANRKSLPLKLLALKAAAFLGWNLDLFEQKLPLTMQQTLINELQKAVDCTELLGDAKEEVGPDAAFALGLRCRWVLRTAVRSRIPVRSAKGIALQLPGQVDPTQVAPEVADAITKACEEECEAASSFLERLLSERWPVRVPTIATFAVLKREEPPSQSHHWDRGVMASQDDLSCQISYELGAFHFYKERYQQAAERFESALRLYSKLKQRQLSQLDLGRLKGFCLACRSGGSRRPSSLLEKLKASLAANCKGLVSVLLEDNVKREIPLWERDMAELRAHQMLPNTEVPTQVSLCNCIRKVVEGDLSLCGTQISWATMDKACIIFLNEALNTVVPSLNVREMGLVRNLVGYLCKVSVDVSKTLACSGVLKKYFPSEQAPTEATPGVTLDRASFAESAATHVGRMERALVASQDPEEILSLVKFLEGSVPAARLPTLSCHWKLTRNLREFHRGLPPQWQGRMYVLLAKAVELRSLKRYGASLALLRTVDSELMPQWRRLASLLASEVRHTEVLQAAASTNLGARKAELAQLARDTVLAYYRDADTDPCQEMAELCCTLLLNLHEWDVFAELERQQRGPVGFLELSKVLSAVCKDVCLNKFTRSIAQELWDLVLSMFTTNFSGHKRGASGTVKDTAQRDANALSRNTFHSFVQQLKDNLALTILLSCLAKLYNILKEDSSAELCLEHAQLWPTVVTSPSSLCKATLTDVFQSTLQHCLAVNNSHAGWVKLLADFCYAQGHHSAALKHYLTSVLMSSDYFSQTPPRTLVDDTMYRKMAHCCTKLQCHTQAALLCQLMEEPDYGAAFKSLNERQCQDSCDSLYAHVWDVVLLEFLVNLHTRRGEVESRQKALRCLGQLELNPNNNQEIQREAANVRRAQFLRVLAKQYL